MKYSIYYMRPEWFGEGIRGAEPDPANLDRTHILLRDVDADNLDQVFHRSQGEVWSPNGEARELILAKGLHHTSMSVGDVIEDFNGNRFLVANLGFKAL